MQTNKKFFYSALFASTILAVREGEDAPIQMTAAELQAKIAEATAAAVQAATTGLQSKNQELLSKMHAQKENLEQFKGVDLERVRKLQEQIDADEDIKLFNEGKKHEVINKHTERMRAAHDEALKAEREKTAAEARRADTYRGAVLDSQILAVTGGLHKGAVEDALLVARTLFSLDANGKAVKLVNGQPELGKDGTTPYSPGEWMEQQKELKPHWFPAGSSGSGSGAARDASGSGKSIKRADFDRLPAHEKASVAVSGTKIVD